MQLAHHTDFTPWAHDPPCQICTGTHPFGWRCTPGLVTFRPVIVPRSWAAVAPGLPYSVSYVVDVHDPFRPAAAAQ